MKCNAVVVMMNMVAFCTTTDAADTTDCSASRQCWALSATTNNNYNCLGYLGCYGASITTTETINCFGYAACQHAAELESSNDVVQCRGDHSCESADVISGAERVHCSGYYACKQATDIESGGAVYCAASGSCMNVESIHAADLIDCSGPSSCQQSTLFVDDGSIRCSGRYACSSATLESPSDVECIGDHSCSNSQVTAGDNVQAYAYRSLYAAHINAERVYGRGYGSLQCATIDSLDELALDVYSTGYYTAINADIICRAGATCNLYCVGTGCKYANLYCFHGATCTANDCNADNDSNDDKDSNGNDCPNWFVSHNNDGDAVLNAKINAAKDVYLGVGC